MTLEDQIKAMGDARAAEVSTPDWRDRRAGGPTGRWLVAAAAVLAVIAGAAFLLRSDDDADTDVVGVEDGAIERWIPGSGVSRIEYPGLFGLWVGSWLQADVALVTPGGVADPDPGDITRIAVGREWGEPTPPAATGWAIDVDDSGIATLDLTRDDATTASITTARFDESELASRAEALLPIANDIDALATAVAAWADELAVAYRGPTVAMDASVFGADASIDDGIVRLDTRSTAQFVASYGVDDDDYRTFVRELFALESAANVHMSEQYLGWSDPAPVRITEAEWMDRLRELIGADPEVRFTGSELFATEAALPATDPPVTAVRDSEFWTVQYNLVEPVTPADGGGFEARIGDAVVLTFAAEPGETYAAIPVRTRMTRAEAELIADTLSLAAASTAATATPDPTTPTLPLYPSVPVPYPTTPTITDGCGNEAIGSGPVAPTLVADIDIDGDGRTDPLWAGTSAGNSSGVLAISLAAGSSNRVFLPAWRTPPEWLGSHDFDGDGVLELLISDPADDYGRVYILRVDGCTLSIPTFGPEWTDSRMYVSPDQDACSVPGACGARVTCDGRWLIAEQTYVNDRRIPEFDYDNPDIRWPGFRWELIDDGWELVESVDNSYVGTVAPQDSPARRGGLFC